MFTLLVIALSLIVWSGLAASKVASASIDRTARVSTRIDALLPQTQCGQCGFDGCLPYAEAVARRAANVNYCPPGGMRTANSIAELVGAEHVTEVVAINPSSNGDAIVEIDAAACIGCTKCLPVCPVDAILGAQKQLHIVLTDLCTGCGLCIPPCPVDCIHPVDAVHDNA